jgi:hypothetical protein
MAELVSIGVPVFRGVDFVRETLQAIRDQTHQEIDVLLFIDGGDEPSATICEPFVRNDSRFRIVTHENQLGWAGNISYLMSQNRAEFWYFNQQDDLVTPDYVQSLLEYARDHPSAAVSYCDIQAFGNLNGEAGGGDEADIACPDHADVHGITPPSTLRRRRLQNSVPLGLKSAGYLTTSLTCQAEGLGWRFNVQFHAVVMI